MSDERAGRGDGLTTEGSPGGGRGFFSGLFQAGMMDPHARRHVHPASPIETVLYGVFFEDAAVGAENFELTPRIQGDTALLDLFIWVGAGSQVSIQHIVSLAYGRVVPADAAAFVDLEPVFPFANLRATVRHQIRFTSAAGGVRITGRFALRPRNRSIVVRFVNTSTAVCDCYVGLVLEESH